MIKQNTRADENLLEFRLVPRTNGDRTEKSANDSALVNFPLTRKKAESFQSIMIRIAYAIAALPPDEAESIVTLIETISDEILEAD